MLSARTVRGHRRRRGAWDHPWGLGGRPQREGHRRRRRGAQVWEGALDKLGWGHIEIL